MACTDLRLPDVHDVAAARERLSGRVRNTPVLRCEALDELAGARVFCKAESLQATGSFKVRGALNKVRSLAAGELAGGLLAVSTGNAAVGAAYAAREAGARLVVVMPETALAEKVEVVRALGGKVESAGIADATAAFLRVAELREAHGYTLIHPFDDPEVIAGAATAAWELLEEVADLEALAVPASGGGLLAGALLAVRALAPRVAVYGVQPAGADGIVRSLAAGRPVAPPRIATLADGLTAPQPGEINFRLIQELATGVLTVDDAEILAAMGQVIRHLKVIVEPAGAAGLAAVVAHDVFRGRRVGVILSGGNTGAEALRLALAPAA
ncbi:MAG TPA: pyridoxal-phosphate dependent enzyme [Thermoanaerobaculia bacterium]|jgi:threonine dehydratase